jgi:hypothetical protein
MKIGKALWAAAICALLSTAASAQATRTWVSGVLGDDANPCSITLPCKTFPGAIAKTAIHGEISVLDPGAFGAVTITKSITISGDGTLASITAFGGTNGVVVNAGPSDVVVIRGISINGVGAGTHGIRFIAGGQLHVENVAITGMTQQGIDFNPSTNSSLFVEHTSIRNAAGGGIWIHPTGTATVSAAINDVALDGNGRGLRAEDGATVVVRNSHASGNGANGFVALAATRPADMTLENVVSSNNVATGVYAGALSTVRISNATVTRNNAGLQTAGGGSIVSFGNNRVLDNSTLNGPATVNASQI